MGQTFAVDLHVAGHQVREISMTWGLRPISDIRGSASTYGIDVDVPAIIELLDLVASGTVTAEQARDSLSYLAEAVNEAKDREYARHLEQIEQARVRSPKQVVQSARVDSRWVYVISSEDNPKVVKIGVAGNIERRIKNLQVGAPTRIILRWSVRGGLPLESHLHEKFRRRRLSGEWFDFRKVANPAKAIEEAAQVFLDGLDPVA